MKIGEAAAVYSAKIKSLNAERAALYEKKKALEKGEISMSDEEVSQLKRSIDRVEVGCEKASSAMEGINRQRTFLSEAENAKRQGEAAAKQSEDYSKCLEVARRLSRGDKVPPKDEEKLMKFSFDMYQMAKNMGAVAQNEKSKKHKSLWKDEDENGSPEKSVEEIVDDMEYAPSAEADFGEEPSFS